MSLSLERTLLVLVCAVLRVPFFGHAAPPTRDPRIEILNHSLDRAHEVRITTPGRRFIVVAAHVDSVGIHWARMAESRDTVPDGGTVAWAEIDQIDVSKSAWTREARRGGRWGGWSGFVGTTVVALAAGQDIDSLTLGLIGGLGGYLVGVTTGASIGAFHRDWRTIYPRRQGWFGAR